MANLNNNNNQAVIFDLGNVVLDWNVDNILSSLDLDTQSVRLLRDELFLHQNWLDMDHGKESESAIVSRVCKRSGLRRTTVEQALLTAKNSLVPIQESVSLINDIADNNIAMYCLSNMSRELYAHIQHYDFFKQFLGIVISGIEGCMKPNDDIFHLIIERFELSPSETLFIDDSLPNIETAQRIGINGFHFKRSENCYQEIREILLG